VLMRARRLEAKSIFCRGIFPVHADASTAVPGMLWVAQAVACQPRDEVFRR
jgi:hypothetical protein